MYLPDRHAWTSPLVPPTNQRTVRRHELWHKSFLKLRIGYRTSKIIESYAFPPTTFLIVYDFLQTQHPHQVNFKSCPHMSVLQNITWPSA